MFNMYEAGQGRRFSGISRIQRYEREKIILVVMWKRGAPPTKIGSNTACLEGVNSYKTSNVEMGDGLNHPKGRWKYRKALLLTMLRP